MTLFSWCSSTVDAVSNTQPRDSTTCRELASPIYVIAMLPYNYGTEEIMNVAKRNVRTYGRSVKTRAKHGRVSACSRSQRLLETLSGIRRKAEEANLVVEAKSGVDLLEGHKSQDDVLNFPRKLFLALESATFCGSISWTPSGNSWRIVNLDTFFANVLPVFTGGSTMAHFRQFVCLLNTWRFHQIQQGPDTSAFHNPFFMHGHHGLLKQLVPIMSPPAPNLKTPAGVSQTYQQLFQASPSVARSDEETASLEHRFGVRLMNIDAKTADALAGLMMSTNACPLQHGSIANKATTLSASLSSCTDGEKLLSDQAQWLPTGERVAVSLIPNQSLV